MRIVIQIAAADDAKAWALLQRHSPGMALPHRTFVVSEEAVRALHDAGIRFTEISRDAVTGTDQGVLAGERI
jgi:hypothetical protein